MNGAFNSIKTSIYVLSICIEIITRAERNEKKTQPKKLLTGLSLNDNILGFFFDFQMGDACLVGDVRVFIHNFMPFSVAHKNHANESQFTPMSY